MHSLPLLVVFICSCHTECVIYVQEHQSGTPRTDCTSGTMSFSTFGGKDTSSTLDLFLQGSLSPSGMAPGPAPAARVPTVSASITLPDFNLQSFDTAAQAQVKLLQHTVPCISLSGSVCIALGYCDTLIIVICYTQYNSQHHKMQVSQYIPLPQC